MTKVSKKHYSPLEIHHVSVSAGDATIIAATKKSDSDMPDYLILIDAGNSKKDKHIIFKYCGDQFGTTDFDYVILSHDHQDHRGYLPNMGPFFNGTKTKLILGDANKATFTNANYKSPAYISFEDTKPYKIDLLKGQTLTCYCAGGVPRDGNFNSSTLNDFLDDDEILDKSFSGFSNHTGYRDNNDLSLAWILEYNPTNNTDKSKIFRYFTAGDLSGDHASKYHNIEKSLLECLYAKGGPLKDNKKNLEIDVIKATHHGSRHSMFGYDNTDKNEHNKTVGASDNNAESYFLRLIKPKTILLPCSNSEDLPMPEFFQRVSACSSVKEVYLVNVFQRDKNSGEHKLQLDIDAWNKRFPKKSNIIVETEKKDEEGGKNEILRTKKSNNKLLAYTVCVTDKATYTIETREVDTMVKVMRAKKLSNEETQNITKQIPGVFFETKDKNGNFLIDTVLTSVKIKDETSRKKVRRLYPNKNTRGDYFFDSSDANTVDFFIDIEKKNNLFNLFDNKKLPRNHDEKEKVILKRVEDFVEKRKLEDESEDENDFQDKKPTKKRKFKK
jgi:hypothetical protein